MFEIGRLDLNAFVCLFVCLFVFFFNVFFLCVCVSFNVYFDKQDVYFDKQVNKKLGEKIESLDFAESNTHRKTNARGSFETYNLFF